MSTTVWGLLAKSLTESEKIEEAIARLILEHCNDETAHLSEGQALYSHKFSTIIDHIVDSIVADKIKGRNIPIPKIDWGSPLLFFNWDTIDGWTKSVFGGANVDVYVGSLRLWTPYSANAYVELSAMSYSEGWGINYLKNPRFCTTVYLFGQTYGIVNIAAGGYGVNCFGFRQEGFKLYAYHEKDGVGYKTEIATLEAGYTPFRLEAVYTSGSKIEFYVNGELLATHTENLPEDGEEAADELTWFDFWVQINNVTQAKVLFVRDLIINQDE